MSHFQSKRLGIYLCAIIFLLTEKKAKKKKDNSMIQHIDTLKIKRPIAVKRPLEASLVHK